MGELYSELVQLPPPSESLASDIQLMYGEICFRCVGMLKECYRFRMNALKAYEELQTKANIAKIINSLEQSSIGSVEAEQTKDGLEKKTNLNDKVVKGFQNSCDTHIPFLICTVCQKKFKNRKMIAMQKTNHPINEQHRCHKCEKEFITKTSCFNHQL